MFNITSKIIAVRRLLFLKDDGFHVHDNQTFSGICYYAEYTCDKGLIFSMCDLRDL